MNNYKKILTENLGTKLHYYQAIDSTNNVAKKMENWAHGTIIVAETQTAGRGTYGRTFYSKVGSGIYMTLILDTDQWHFKKIDLATHFTAVAVSEAIVEITHISPEIKWVNDLFINCKKIGGILTEKEFQSNKLVVGIGINVSSKQQDFPDEIKNTAASLALGHPVDDQAAAIVTRIYELMMQPGDLSNWEIVLSRYKEKLFILNRVVEVIQGDKVFVAKVVDVDKRGRLLVNDHGENITLEVGEVRIKW